MSGANGHTLWFQSGLGPTGVATYFTSLLLLSCSDSDFHTNGVFVNRKQKGSTIICKSSFQTVLTKTLNC